MKPLLWICLLCPWTPLPLLGENEAPIKEHPCPLPEQLGRQKLGKQMFRHLDRDEDGLISLSEFKENPRLNQVPTKQQQRLFTRLDKNNDGYIDPREVRKSKPKPPHHLHDSIRLKRGPVSFTQFIKRPRIAKLPEHKQLQIFKRLDRNGDGVFDHSDLPTNHGPHGEKPPPPSFKELDLNQDGAVSFTEFKEIPRHQERPEKRLRKRFNHMDRNGDGLLSPSESQRPSPERSKNQKTE